MMLVRILIEKFLFYAIKPNDLSFIWLVSALYVLFVSKFQLKKSICECMKVFQLTEEIFKKMFSCGVIYVFGCFLLVSYR